jgi:hypothetical protein
MEENGLITADSSDPVGCSGTLCIRIFNSPMEGTDIGRDYGDPTDGDNCVERPQLGGCTTGVGATVDQTVTVYTHAFYNFMPADDWQFSVHGHPVPPS